MGKWLLRLVLGAGALVAGAAIVLCATLVVAGLALSRSSLGADAGGPAAGRVRVPAHARRNTDRRHRSGCRPIFGPASAFRR